MPSRSWAGLAIVVAFTILMIVRAVQAIGLLNIIIFILLVLAVALVIWWVFVKQNGSPQSKKK